MNDLYIIGCGNQAKLMYQYFIETNNIVIKGFAVSKREKTQDIFCNTKVYELDELDNINCYFFIAISYQNMNEIRQNLYNFMINKGFIPYFYIDNSAKIAKSAKLGKHNCIFEHVTIQHNVIIGNNNIIYSNTSISHDTKIFNNCYISQNVAICGNVTIGNNCFIGAGAVIHNDICIGDYCLVGANAVISKNIGNNNCVIPTYSTISDDAYNRFVKWYNKHK
jgi:sugar O-acyltransferase (sialic acid O-acetyltransferase NeuD family)